MNVSLDVKGNVQARIAGIPKSSDYLDVNPQDHPWAFHNIYCFYNRVHPRIDVTPHGVMYMPIFDPASGFKISKLAEGIMDRWYVAEEKGGVNGQMLFSVTDLSYLLKNVDSLISVISSQLRPHLASVARGMLSGQASAISPLTSAQFFQLLAAAFQNQFVVNLRSIDRSVWRLPGLAVSSAWRVS
jgi:hypothetical protein